MYYSYFGFIFGVRVQIIGFFIFFRQNVIISYFQTLRKEKVAIALIDGFFICQGLSYGC